MDKEYQVGDNNKKRIIKSSSIRSKEFRDRKKFYFKSIENTMKILKEENKALKEENNKQKKEIITLKLKISAHKDVSTSSKEGSEIK
mmetsp:Transcript_20062/g.17758  ORF Transcript_20062/g.17758 Transcript_20062/m.17758 type:complete len:87 (+) Transcript_20062:17-277(+)